MPILRRWAGRPVTSWPSRRTRPDEGVTNGDDPERGGLSASRGTEQPDELSSPDIDRERLDGDRIAVDGRDAVENEVAYGSVIGPSHSGTGSSGHHGGALDVQCATW